MKQKKIHIKNFVLRFFCLVLFICFIPCVFGQNTTKQSLESERQELIQQIELAKQQLSHIKNNKKNSLAEIALIKKKMTLREKKINLINRQIKEIEEQVLAHKKDIEKIKIAVVGLRKQYKNSIVVAYKNTQLYNPSYYLFSSNSFSILADRIIFLKKFRQLRNQQLNSIKNTSNKLESEIETLSNTEKNQLQALQEQKQEMNILKNEQEEKKNIVRQLKINENRLIETLQIKMKKWRKIKTAIEKIVRDEIASKNKKMLDAQKHSKKEALTNKKNEKENLTPTEKNSKMVISALTYSDKDFNLSKNFQANKGKLPWPVPNGIITMRFGKNKLTDESKITYDNSGLTIQTEPNSVVRSVFNGIISNIQEMDEGFLITVRHGQFWSIYVPIQKPLVKANDEVKTGQILGYSSSNNPSELEFQILKETSFQNPETWLK